MSNLTLINFKNLFDNEIKFITGQEINLFYHSSMEIMIQITMSMRRSVVHIENTYGYGFTLILFENSLGLFILPHNE